jgi:predicted ATPase
MAKEIRYIKTVEIEKLWGKYNIVWDLHPDVNILAGGNGSGKTTVLNGMWLRLFPNNAFKDYKIQAFNTKIDFEEVEITENKEAKIPRFWMVSTFDNRIIEAEAIQKLSEYEVKTMLDWEIYHLQVHYLNYQLDLSKRKDEITDKSDNIKEELIKLRKPLNRFWEMLDELFSETGKKVDKNKNEISFLLDNQVEIKPYQLSSGEKQMLIILLTTLIQDHKHTILLMDEPEISLHIDWQRKLIGYIRELNPNAQLIIATHSPAIIMEGWLDKVFEMNDLIKNKTSAA